MASMPWWAKVAAGAYGLDKFGIEPARSGYGLYKDIRDDANTRRDAEATQGILSDYASATGPEDVQFIQRTLPSYGLSSGDTAIKMKNEGDSLIKGYEKTAEQGRLNSALQRLQQVRQDFPDLPPGAILAKMQPEDSAVIVQNFKGAMDDTMKAYDVGVKDFQEQKAKDANLAQFAQARNVASSFLAPDQSPATRGQYQDAASIRADVGSSLADYALTEPQVNSINAMLDKGISDKFIRGKQKKVGNDIGFEQTNPYTGEVKFTKEGDTQKWQEQPGNKADSEDDGSVTISLPGPDGGVLQQTYNSKDPLHRKLIQQVRARIARGEAGLAISGYGPATAKRLGLKKTGEASKAVQVSERSIGPQGQTIQRRYEQPAGMEPTATTPSGLSPEAQAYLSKKR